MNEIEINEIEQIVSDMYLGYASSSGYLFGIPPNLKDAVYAITKVIVRNRLTKFKILKAIQTCVGMGHMTSQEIVFASRLKRELEL